MITIMAPRDFKKLHLAESIRETFKESLVESVENDVHDFVRDILDSALDNLSQVVAQKIKNYDPDWCDVEGDSSLANQLSKNLDTVADSIVSVLFANKINESLKESTTYDEPERMGKAHCAPTVPVISSYIEDVLNEIKKGNDAEFLKASLKNWKSLLDETKQDVENFNTYWTQRYEASINAF